jgi:hypothetical protein
LNAALAAAALLCLPVLLAQTAAPTTNCPTPVKHHFGKKPAPAPCADFSAQLAKQQKEIDDLKAQLAGQQPAATLVEKDPVASPVANQAALDAAAAKDAAEKAAAAAAAATAGQDSLRDGLTTLQKRVLDDESPAAIHYKDITITPGGFVAAETVYRNRVFNSDIATPFNSTPYKNSSNAYLSEFNATARQSRISLLATSPFAWGKASGYFETDFLSAGTTSNDNQTNSYTLRIRTAFATAALNSGLTVQGGQMWTLATEVKKGIAEAPGQETLPPTIDPNYHVGFDFGRQYGFRVSQAFAGGKVNAAASVEASQIIFTGSNAPGNFILGGAGSGGGLYNSTANYSDNVAPDLHLKVTADPGKGHYELGGITRFFRDRIYPQTAFSTANTTDTTAGATSHTSIGAGVYASARVPVTKYADVALKATYGKGIGRYEASNLGDVTARPDGVLVPLKTGDGLFELDLHPTKKLDVYFLAGAEYLQRTTYLSSTGVQVGYAGITTQNNSGCGTQPVPGTTTLGYTPGASPCSGATRYLFETTAGMTYRFYSSPTKGRLQAQIIGSYLDRMSWQGYTGTSFATSTAAAGQFHGAQATAAIVETSFRYYLP